MPPNSLAAEPCSCPSPSISSPVKDLEIAMQQVINTPLTGSTKIRRPHLHLTTSCPPAAHQTITESPSPSTYTCSDEILLARSQANGHPPTPVEQSTSCSGWETTSEAGMRFFVVRKHNVNEEPVSKPSPKSIGVTKKALPVRKVSTGNLTPTLKIRPSFKGIENERKLSSLRFSPTRSPVRPRHILLAESPIKSNPGLGKVTPKSSPAPMTPKASAPNQKIRCRPGAPTVAKPKPTGLRGALKSKIPVPTNMRQGPTVTEAQTSNSPEASEEERENLLNEVNPGLEAESRTTSAASRSFVFVVSPTDSTHGSLTTTNASSSSQRSPIGTGERSSVYEVSGPFTYTTKTKLEALQAFGYRDPVFQAERAFLQDFPDLLERLESRNFEGDLNYELVTIKRKELSGRIAVVNTIYEDAKRAQASENEIMCITGWSDSLLKEAAQIDHGEVRYHKSWVRHIVDWLWGIENIKMGRYNHSQTPPGVLEPPEDHPLFNLCATVNELMREGFNGKEKQVVLLWADVRGVPLVASACGKAILHEYITRLTRWDGGKLESHAVQERRMHYFCLRHYNHWKSAVSQYNLALKMMNLLIVFHDLWGMHVDGMTIHEKNDYGSLHDNLYSFACLFERPNGPEMDSVWKGNECFHCFCKTATNPIDKERSRSLWYWLLLLTSVIGYGSYHTALLQTMTADKSPEYTNRLLDTTYYRRQYSMMTGVKRINASVRKQAKVDSLIRPLGTISNKYINDGPLPVKIN